MSGSADGSSRADASTPDPNRAGLTEREAGQVRTVTADEFVQDVRANLTPDDFEYFVADVWEALGYETMVTQGSGDRGVDVVAKGGGEKVIIQAKLYGPNSSVGGPDVREYGALFQQENADRVLIVNTGSFTSQAHEVAPEIGVEFVDGDDLFDVVSEHDLGHLVSKYTGHVGEYEPKTDGGVSLRRTVGRWAPLWALVSAPLVAFGLLGVLTIVSGGSPGGSGSPDLSFLESVFVLTVFLSMLMFPTSLFVRGNRLRYPALVTIGAYFGISLVAGSAGAVGLASLTLYGAVAVVFLLDHYTPAVPVELDAGEFDAGTDDPATGEPTVIEDHDAAQKTGDETTSGYDRLDPAAADSSTRAGGGASAEDAPDATRTARGGDAAPDATDATVDRSDDFATEAEERLYDD